MEMALALQGANLTGLQFDLEVPAALSVTFELAPAAAAAGKSLSTSDVTPNRKRVLVAGLNQNPLPDGAVIVLAVTVKPGTPAGELTLALVNASATDRNAAVVTLATANGSVTVSGASPPAVAADLTVSSAQSTPGQTVRIDITLASTATPLTGLQFDLEFDSRFSISATLASAIRDAGKDLSTSDVTSNRKRFLIAGLNQNPLPPGLLATLAVNVPPATTIGDYPLKLSNATGTDRTAKLVTLSGKDGLLTIGAGGSLPRITSVRQPADFGGAAAIASGGWVEIYGENFRSGALSWEGRFEGNRAPVVIEGLSVEFGGKPAFLQFVSANQINAQVPDGIGVGPTPVQARNSSGPGNLISVNSVTRSPCLWAPRSFAASGHQYVGAVGSGGVYIGPAGLVPGLSFRPAKSGEVVTLYGTGFGPTIPAVPAGLITGELSDHSGVQVLVGQTPARVLYAGYAIGFVGLTQINLVVPSLASGDHPFSISVDAQNGGQTLSIRVE